MEERSLYLTGSKNLNGWVLFFGDFRIIVPILNGDVFVFVIVGCCRLLGRLTFLSLFVFVNLFLLPNTWKIEPYFAFVDFFCCRLPGRWTFLSFFVFVNLFLLQVTWPVGWTAVRATLGGRWFASQQK